MNFRVTFILVILLAVVGGYVLAFELQRRPPKEPEPPFSYDVVPEDITGVSVTYQGQRQDFLLRDTQWSFQDSGEPVDQNRWSGITLLLSGPKAARVLKETADNPAEYGLEPPEITIVIALKGGRQINVLLGTKTPDGLAHYSQVVGYQPLLLISSSWGDVISRLVTEPPVATATPTPAAPEGL